MVNYSSLLEAGERPTQSTRQREEESSSTYGSIACFSCTLNCIIGTGVLGLPFMFATCGLGLATSILTAGALLCGISMTWTLEAMARAEGCRRFREDEQPWKGHEIATEKFDFAKIARLFGGWRLEIITQLAVVFYAFGALWSYASVFGSTSAALYRQYIANDDISCDVSSPLASSACQLAYKIAVLIFGCIVLVLALIDLGDQSTAQTIMSIYRILALLAMIITALSKIQNDGIASGVTNFRMNEFGVGFGPVFLAVNAHYNVPDLIGPLRNKRNAGFVVYSAMALSVSFYLLVGLSTALAFGANTAPLATLNWADYPWDLTEQHSLIKIYGQLLLRFLVILCPVVNVVSAYPIIVCTVSENLQHTFRPTRKQAVFRLPPRSPAFNSPRAQGQPHVTPVTTRRAFKEGTLLRVFVAIIPLVFAILVRRLDLIFSISGIFGFVLGLVLPTAYQLFLYSIVTVS